MDSQTEASGAEGRPMSRPTASGAGLVALGLLVLALMLWLSLGEEPRDDLASRAPAAGHLARSDEPVPTPAAPPAETVATPPAEPPATTGVATPAPPPPAESLPSPSTQTTVAPPASTPSPPAPPRRPSRVASAPATAAPPAAAAAVVYPSLFNSREIRGSNFTPFPKWTGVLDRQVNEGALYDGPCTARRFNRCHLQEWRALLKSLAGKDRRSQLEAVNAFMNKAPYIIDPVNYRVPDYWATPIQFLNKDGDCEDYAIAKFISLRELGWPNELLRLVVLDDLNLGIAHAVLVAYVDGEALVLDNQIPKVVSSKIIRHYRPIYSINEESWWLHRPL